MFGHLPLGILSQQGYRGCLASLELGGEAAPPLLSAVVPSDEVVPGCQGKFVLTRTAAFLPGPALSYKEREIEIEKL